MIRDGVENVFVGFHETGSFTRLQYLLKEGRSLGVSRRVTQTTSVFDIHNLQAVLVHHMLEGFFFFSCCSLAFSVHILCVRSYVVLITTVCKISWQIFAGCLKEVVGFIEIVILLAAKWNFSS